jgi:hypothetical protein
MNEFVTVAVHLALMLAFPFCLLGVVVLAATRLFKKD